MTHDDPLRYERLIEDALRGVVRSALRIVAEQGLPDGHHLHISFRTDFPGVEMAAPLRLQYPEEMTIVLQHMFWDLEVEEEFFSIALAFNTVRQHLIVPFAAITVFQDQSVGFVLQFQARGDEDENEDENEDETMEDLEIGPAGIEDVAADAAKPSDGDNIVTLDKFRKK